MAAPMGIRCGTLYGTRPVLAITRISLGAPLGAANQAVLVGGGPASTTVGGVVASGRCTGGAGSRVVSVVASDGAGAGAPPLDGGAGSLGASRSDAGAAPLDPGAAPLDASGRESRIHSP